MGGRAVRLGEDRVSRSEVCGEQHLEGLGGTFGKDAELPIEVVNSREGDSVSQITSISMQHKGHFTP